MLSYTYTSLKAHLQAWIEGNGTDASAEFIAALPEIIQMGEARVYRDLNLANIVVSFAAVTVIGAASVTKTSNILTEQSVGIVSPSRKLIKRSAAFVEAMNRDGTQAIPKYYAEQSETAWIVAPLPDQVYTLVIRATSIATGTNWSLVDASTTWISTRYADLLAAACEISAADNLKNYARKADAESKYTGLLDNIKGDTAHMRVALNDASPRPDRQPILPGDPSDSL